MNRPMTGAALAVAMVLSAPAQAQFKTPEDAVQTLYGLYKSDDSNGFQDKQAPRFLDAALLKMWKAARNKEADFFVQGQDFKLSDLKVAPAVMQDDKASVTASFRNMGAPMTITFAMVKAKDGWRISDAAAEDKSTLRQSLRAAR